MRVRLEPAAGAEAPPPAPESAWGGAPESAAAPAPTVVCDFVVDCARPACGLQTSMTVVTPAHFFDTPFEFACKCSRPEGQGDADHRITTEKHANRGRPADGLSFDRIEFEGHVIVLPPGFRMTTTQRRLRSSEHGGVYYAFEHTVDGEVAFDDMPATGLVVRTRKERDMGSADRLDFDLDGKRNEFAWVPFTFFRAADVRPSVAVDGGGAAPAAAAQ